jgi:hypothetical protein
MVIVQIEVLAVDEYIIKENKYKFSKKGFEDLVHQSLKRGWGVC